MHNNNYMKLTASVLTVSDTRTVETDKGGKQVIKYLEDINVEIKTHAIVKDDIEAIRTFVSKELNFVDVVITTGGTGVAKRDVTIEALKPLVTKELEGFGEIFRYLSYTEDVGSRAILSRAFCGVVEDKIIFAIPGSVGAVNLVMKKLITEEIFHIANELRK